MIGKVGDDMFGRLLKQTLADAGIYADLVAVDPEHFTTLAFVSLSPDGNRDFSFARKPGADTCLTTEVVDEETISNSRVFHFGTLSLTDEPAASATRRALELARKHNLLISHDPNLRKPLWKSEAAAKAAIEWSLSRSDIVKISDEEIQYMWGLDPQLGSKGCYAATRNVHVTVPSLTGIHVIDTTGAGDIFGGSAMSRLLKLDKHPSELTEDELTGIVSFACTAAGLSTQKHGGITSVPTLEEVLAQQNS